MPYFPLFVNLDGKKVVVAGGGSVASRKVEKLLPFRPKITVVAPKVTTYLQNLEREKKIKLLKRKLRFTDLKGAFIVIVAVDDFNLQKRVYSFCTKRGIHCNAVDNPDFCTFLFPALIFRDELVLGISTSGRVPALSAGVRELVEKALPEDLESIFLEIDGIRKSLPKGKKRQELIKNLVRKRLGL